MNWISICVYFFCVCKCGLYEFDPENNRIAIAPNSPELAQSHTSIWSDLSCHWRIELFLIFSVYSRFCIIWKLIRFVLYFFAAGELGNAVQDAFVIAVEQQARERLQRLSALKRITPVDMSQLSIKVSSWPKIYQYVYSRTHMVNWNWKRKIVDSQPQSTRGDIILSLALRALVWIRHTAGWCVSQKVRTRRAARIAYRMPYKLKFKAECLCNNQVRNTER